MTITRTSVYSGVTRTMDLPITEAQLAAWEEGMLIQEAFPNITPGQREFILSGMTQNEWVEMFGEDEEE